MQSLRRRAILGGSIWAILCVGIGVVALYSFFDSLTQRRFDQALSERHLQVVIALSNSDADADLMPQFINDPIYERPYSGRYWQANGPNRQILTSRSLFDAVFAQAGEAPPAKEFWTGDGPDGEVRGVRQSIILEDGSAWVVVVADSLAGLVAEQRTIRRSLLLTFGLVGALGVAGAMLQTLVVVRPLRKLREDVAHRWDMETDIDPTNYPEEVAPLVEDINALLERNREIVARGRRQAADMAHALKTPSAILRNELESLNRKKVDVSQAQDALNRIDSQLQRSLARIRAANSGASMHQRHTNLLRSVERLANLFRGLPDFKLKELVVAVPPKLTVPMDPHDLEEVLGNIIENASLWSQSQVSISCRTTGEFVEILVEDDGPGISEINRSEALRSGGRLDTTVPGTGLGLAIVGDLLHAYGGELYLEKSARLSGLRVVISIPGKPLLGLRAGSDVEARRASV
ncbi:MAG: HAMP domain-containing sensor histidine kinase [Paracoccaceae bacterium]